MHPVLPTCSLLLSLLLAQDAPAVPERAVAVTFDDLPAVSAVGLDRAQRRRDPARDPVRGGSDGKLECTLTLIRIGPTPSATRDPAPEPHSAEPLNSLAHRSP